MVSAWFQSHTRPRILRNRFFVTHSERIARIVLLTTAGTTMADRSGLKLVGIIFATVTFAVMLTAVMVVKSYADGTYQLEVASLDR
jgi:hypothetical protein